jgi:diketogulonate reductase-like aldo/keto reductase
VTGSLFRRLLSVELGHGACLFDPCHFLSAVCAPVMICKELARTGVHLPEIAMGTWRYQGGIAPLIAGVASGAGFIDTAESYGTEEVVGQAIKGIRSQVFLATKVSPRHFRRGDVIRAAEASLKRLNTDYIDLYQLHWPNYRVPISETMSAMERLVETGKVRFIGVSNFSVAELRRAQAQLSTARIVSNQVRYSLLDRTPENEMLPYCEANGINLLAFSPLGSNFASLLSADHTDNLGEIAGSIGKTRAQVALNWCVSHAAVIAIFKADKSEHVRENCSASGWSLTAAAYQRLTEGITANYTRSKLEQFVRRIARCALQHVGRNLGPSSTVGD